MKNTFPTAALPPALLAGALLLLAAAPLPAAPVPLAEPVLAFETDPGTEFAPLDPGGIAAIGGRLYFAGHDAAGGAEPWISDGSAAGTRQLADLCPGPCSSSPAGFTELGGSAVFFSYDGSRGALYRLAGGGVEQIARPGRATSWARLGAELYFITEQYRLFRTDGNAAGTVQVASFPCPDADCWPAEHMRAAGGAIYFAAAGHLYRVRDGEAPVALAPMYQARGFTAAGPWVVFVGCPEFNEDCLAYATDGTAAGTRELPGLPAGGLPAYFDSDLVAFGGRVYFPVVVSDSGPATRVIASTDGSDAPLTLDSFLSDMPDLLGATADRLIYQGNRGSGRSLMARDAAGVAETLVNDGGSFQLIGEYAGGLVFTYGETGFPAPPGFRLLGFTDGRPANTVELGELQAAKGGAELHGRFYFAGSDSGVRGLWRTDGTAAGTAEVLAGIETPRGAAPRPYRVGSKLIFDTYDPFYHYEPEIWQLDPATFAAQQLREDAKVLAAGGGKAYFYGISDAASGWPLLSFDGTAVRNLERPGYYDYDGAGELAQDGHFFFFTDIAPGQRLWESDGTAAGTRLLADYGSGQDCGAILCGHLGAIVPSGDHVFYWAQQDGGPAVSRLRVWDRVRQESTWVFEGLGWPILPAAVSGGRAVFLDRGTASGLPGPLRQKYWITDGRPDGTRSFFDVPAGFEATLMEVAGERLFFVLRALAEPNREQLWVSDFTTAGTRPLVTASSFTELQATGDHLFFAADAGAGQEPGYTDGSAAGGRFLDLRPGPEGSRPRHPFTLDDGRVVFAADAEGAGDELWISDGTATGTYRLTDLNPGAAGSSPSHFAQVGGRLFFQATNGTSGRELWALDLPAALPLCPANRLCLLGDRFEVAVVAHAPDGDFVGQRALASAESGVFTFFTPNNWEMMVKVLDGSCGINDRFWVFAAVASDVPYTLTVTDRANGTRKVYESAGLPAGPLLDIEAFATCGLPAPEPRHPPALEAAPPASRCAADPSSLCFGPGGRYRVTARWRTATAEGAAHPAPYGSADSGLLTFFSPSNWELMVKVLDGCALGGKIWVFAAGSTDVGWTLEVRDRATGATKVYENPLGQPSRTVADTAAFNCN